MNKKEFRTLDEQIDILKSKDLVISNESYAKDIFGNLNRFVG